ncbi:Flagellar basal-body P-ring formation protein FlgA [hydrothermal vent metagenome]|uniref:Flagellar basal-body P-ring formation protein FlgA n=1 Tax=hydrothermal vent metagenome TaxID=652676 RepID=A0A1W1D5R9_9ZZZZ
MLSKILFISLLISSLYANKTLKKEYYVPTNSIKLSYIIPNVKNDKEILSIINERYTLRIKSKYLLKILQQNGYKNYKATSNYINFIRKSDIDTSLLQNYLIRFYKKHYDIKFQNIEIKPRGFIQSMPKHYTIKIQRRSFLKNKGIISIKSDNNKQFFFNYTLDAFINVYKTTKKIQRGEELSFSNCAKESIMLHNFYAQPIKNLQKGKFESKYLLKQGHIITQRDISKLKLIHRGEEINLFFQEGNIAISLVAKALQNGAYGDIIKVKNKNGKILHIRVTGKNKGEVL